MRCPTKKDNPSFRISTFSLCGWFTICALALWLIFFFPADTSAQDMNEELVEALDELREELDDVRRTLADEYLEILAELERLLEDYRRYFADMPRNQRPTHDISFDPLASRLRDGKYIDSPKLLTKDIRTLFGRLASLEEEHGAAKKPASCCNVVRNLRRELKILDSHVDEYLSSQTEQQLLLVETRKYLETELPRLMAELSAELQDQTRELRLMREETKIIVHAEPAIPKSPQPGSIEDHERSESDITGALIELPAIVDTVWIRSSDETIHVINLSGDLRISGWNKPFVVARLVIKIAQPVSGREHLRTVKSSFEVTTTEDGYRIGVNIPDAMNLHGNLMHSMLVVHMPRKNPLIAENGFGQLDISNLRSDVSIKGRHSEINVDEIKGNVSVANSQGTTRLTSIDGRISVNETRGEVIVTGGNGIIEIDNNYGTIKLMDSRGQASVIGSGKVTANGFKGDLLIDNRFGPVEVRNIDGDIDIRNAFETLRVRGITGSTKLSNSYSNIIVYKVGGMLNVNNKNGLIFAEAIKGPIKLQNEDGAIRLIIDDRLKGTSKIFNHSGEISIELLRRGDVVLSVQTVEGDIIGALPWSVENKGSRKSAKISFGRAIDSLLISGKNSVVTISEGD